TSATRKRSRGAPCELAPCRGLTGAPAGATPAVRRREGGGRSECSLPPRRTDAWRGTLTRTLHEPPAESARRRRAHEGPGQPGNLDAATHAAGIICLASARARVLPVTRFGSPGSIDLPRTCLPH